MLSEYDFINWLIMKEQMNEWIIEQMKELKESLPDKKKIRQLSDEYIKGTNKITKKWKLWSKIVTLHRRNVKDF